jgi:uncharacterized OB-fold protein
VSWLTAVPLAGTSSRTVIEYETLGAVAMTTFFRFLLECCAVLVLCRKCASIVAPTQEYR